MSQQRNNQKNTQNNVKGPRMTSNGQARQNIGGLSDKSIKNTPRNTQSQDSIQRRSQANNEIKRKSSKNSKNKSKKVKKKRFRRTCLGF